MARRSQCSSAGDNPLDPNYLPPHYREEYRLAIDALVEEDLEGYNDFLQSADVVDFLSIQEIEYIKHTTQEPYQSTQPERRHLDARGDGSSDTYWPLHSDLDAPGLDLGWPQPHHFIGPTEVTTLVNPSEPDVPSIKDQARRLIKNAQQVVAVVMDMFTDVDIFADILDAARRNVAVYVLLDEHNVHHFTNMVSSCRVNLNHIPFMRVRTVSGLTYYCRSGKSFKGQMMDRFLLTDCRAVLSGNYSFMWSFEKIHRCIAHLFLGQLVTTFDEEFRILFAQSQPLILEDALAPKPKFSSLSDRQYSTNRVAAPRQGTTSPMFRDPRKFLGRESSHLEEWARHSFDERMDMERKRMPLRKHELIHKSLDQGQLEMYSDKYSAQQVRMDPSVIEQGHPMMPPDRIESDAFRRHSFAECLPSYHFTQPQAVQRFETQGRQMHREHSPYQRAGPEPGYGGYEFRGYGYPTMDQYSESEYPQDMEPDSYDPVLNYLASTSAIEMEDDSDKVSSEEVPFGPPLRAAQPYEERQNSPMQQNPLEQNPFFQGPSKEHSKDLSVKQGMRDWRINSYLSALEDTGEDLSVEPCGTNPFDEPFQPPFNISQVKPLSAALADPRFRTRELPKIQTVPRLSNLHCYTKPIVPEHLKKLPVDNVTMATQPQTTPTTPSESSSNTEGDKTEEVEVKDPKEVSVRREESFRKRYNAAVQRSSRLRSSLIFSSQLEQHFSQEPKNTPDEGTAKNEDDQSKLSFISKALLGKHRSIAREPFEWSRSVKSVIADDTTAESSNSDDLVHDTGVQELPKSLPVTKDIKEQPKPVEAEQPDVLPSVHPAKPSQDEQLQAIQPTHPAKPLVSNTPFIDMSDADNRLMFFKELAAQRKAAKAAELEKGAEKAFMKPDLSVTTCDPKTSAQKVEPKLSEVPYETAETSTNIPATSTDAGRTPTTTLPSQEMKSNMSVPTSHLNVKEQVSGHQELGLNPPRKHSEPLLSCNEGAGAGSTDAEKIELKKSQSGKDKSMASKNYSSLIGLNESDLCKSTLNRTAEKEYSPPSCSKTSSPTSAVPSETSPLSPHNQSTQEPSAANPATKKPSSSHPLTSPDALLSPTPKDSSSDTKGSTIGLNLDLKDPTSSIPISNEELIPSKLATLISNTQTLSSIPPGSSSSTYPSPSEAPAPPAPVSSVTSSTPQPVPPESVLSPQTILSECTTFKAVPSESGSAIPTIPTQSILSPGQNESALPSEPEKVMAKKSHSPALTESPSKTNRGESSLPKPASDEFILFPKPPETESISPQPTMVKSATSTSLQPIRSKSVTSPVLSELFSSEIAPSESSPITSTITQQSKSNESPRPSPTGSPTRKSSRKSSEPDQIESVLSHKPPQIQSSSSSHLIPMESTTSSNLSLPSSKDVTEESNICPSPCQKDTNSTQIPIATESCTSPMLGPDQSVLSAQPEQNKPITLPNTSQEPSSAKSSSSPDPASQSGYPPKTDLPSLTAKELCTSSVSGSDSDSLVSPTSDKTEDTTSPYLSAPSDKSSTPPEPTSTESRESLIANSTEFCPSSMHSIAESTSSVLTDGNSIRDSSAEFSISEPPVFVEKGNEVAVEVSKESKPKCSVLKGESKTEEVEAKTTANKSPPEESGCHGSQSDETKVNDSTMPPSESTPDQVSPLSPQSKNSKVSQSRYHSSTAKVLSSSNLRDDTKLLLEQISANRTELVREESEEGEALHRFHLKRRARTPQEREDLLQKIQSMRSERKVYSRFEMGP